jgi:acylphosphatase
MNVRVHIFISGRVQGVFFRSRTQKEANKHSVKGWIRNLQDGRVETLLEGREEDVKRLIEFCKKGPPYAIVKDIKIEWKEYKNEFQDFRIIYV